jgi:hypothetical protein
LHKQAYEAKLNKNYTLQLKVFTHFIKPSAGDINLSLAIAKIAAIFTIFGCCCWRPIDHLFTLIGSSNVCKNLRFNENSNAAVVESPPYVHKIMNFCKMKPVHSYSLFMDYPGKEAAAKLIYLNEKPNYHSCIRKAEPHCLT